MKFAGKSDIGLIRRKNEDAYCVVDFVEAHNAVVLAVADGMGGHRAGDVASKMSIDHVRDSITKEPIDISSFDTIKKRLRNIVKQTNEIVYKRSITDPECFGMGTTLVIAVINNASAVLAHIGDSCAYHCSDKKMDKITTDHTYVEELVRMGTLTREEALNHPQRNYITKVIGCFQKVEADYYNVEMAPNDRILLCSDGLSNMVRDDDILKIMYSSDNPEKICSKLISAANKKGGADNTTAVVFLNSDEV